MRITAQEVYEKLINEDKIFEIQGQIKFYLGDVSIIVKQRDVVGNIIQEWLQGWLDHHGIEYAPSENSQMPPDFFLNPDNLTENLLEVKAFNRNASAAFDIADFRMYAEEIIEKPYMLNVDYLIFGYDMTDDGYVVIKDLWLKKVWQITRRMEDYPINLQIKDGVIHKIRPAAWYSEAATDYTVFTSLEDFICAIEETVYLEPKFRNTIASTWLTKFKRNYRATFGVELDIPRWNSIKDKYDMKSVRIKEKAQEDVNKAEEALQKAKDKLNDSQKKLEAAKTDKQKEKALAAIEKAKEKVSACENKVAVANQKLNALI